MTKASDIALHEATRYRYLSYAMSVITSRALPDVRDGLKPVQRRILFAMYHNLKLYPEGRYRKSAAVVGEVMAKYHPHGDSSIYDAMVRMAQPFSLLHTLVDGQGNFGSMDGDSAAAMRYTEAKLTPLAIEILSEIKQDTVSWQQNYDGQHSEPSVLPAQLPNLLINGSEGIAVGMSTRIPPHNLREVIDACILMLDKPDATSTELAKKVRAPDFPTGGMILNNRAELRKFYAKGQGTIKLRGTWTSEKDGRKNLIVIDSVPYGVNKSTLVEKIGDLIAQKKVPQLVDVRDESTDKVRVVLELKIRNGRTVEGERESAMAYLCRYTPLQNSFPMNLTCLIPKADLLSDPSNLTETASAKPSIDSDVETAVADDPEIIPDICMPVKAELRQIIYHWLRFRRQTIIRRYNYELKKLRERLHLLEAFERAFDVLDEIIALIRASEGRSDAREKLMERYNFDQIQAEAILDLRLYKLAKLEIHAIEEELRQKRTEAQRIIDLLSSPEAITDAIKSELTTLRGLYGKPRRTKIGGEEATVTISDDSAYIVDEKVNVVVTQFGWIKRQGRFTSLEKIRIKDGDTILAVARARTTSTISFYTSIGNVYVLRVVDIPSTTGYGDPIQKFFKLTDGELVIGVIANDALSLPSVPSTVEIEDDQYPPPFGVGVTKHGRCIRFSLKTQAETTNKSGRRYLKVNPPSKKGPIEDAVIAVYPVSGSEHVSLLTAKNRGLSFPVAQITLVRGPGKGVYAMKLEKGDHICGFEISSTPRTGITTQTPRGRELCISPKRYGGNRAAKGQVLLKRGQLPAWELPLIRLDTSFASEKKGQTEETETSAPAAITENPAPVPISAQEPSSQASPTDESNEESSEETSEETTPARLTSAELRAHHPTTATEGKRPQIRTAGPARDVSDSDATHSEDDTDPDSDDELTDLPLFKLFPPE